MKILNKNGEPTKEFFLFLKYNKIFKITTDTKMSKADLLLYEEFCKKYKNLIKSLESDNSASSILGSLFAIFGFKRHYCSTCGLPIIGRFSKVTNMILCSDCFASYKIIQEIEVKEREEAEKVKKMEKMMLKNEEKNIEKTTKET